MSKSWNSRRVHGSIADIATVRAKKLEKRCATDGCGVLLQLIMMKAMLLARHRHAIADRKATTPNSSATILFGSSRWAGGDVGKWIGADWEWLDPQPTHWKSSLNPNEPIPNLPT